MAGIRLSASTIAFFQQPPPPGQLTDTIWSELGREVRRFLVRYSGKQHLRIFFIYNHDWVNDILENFYKAYCLKGPFHTPEAMLTTMAKNYYLNKINKKHEISIPLYEKAYQDLDSFGIDYYEIYNYIKNLFYTESSIMPSPDEPYRSLALAVAELDPRCRELIRLRIWQQLPPEAVAAEMNRQFPRADGTLWQANNISTEVSKNWNGRCQQKFNKLLQTYFVRNKYSTDDFHLP